jgi:hypothetical protein
MGLICVMWIEVDGDRPTHATNKHTHARTTLTGVHGDEKAAAGLEEHLLGVTRELEVLQAGLLGVLDGEDLGLGVGLCGVCMCVCE